MEHDYDEDALQKAMDELEPTDKELEKIEKNENAISNMRKKHQFETVQEKCPICEHYPLETQIFGYERSIFCVNCSYQRTIDIN